MTNVRWLAGGLALAFALPYALADQWRLERDVYYGVHACVVFVFFALWLAFGSGAPRRALVRNWRLGAGLGVAFAAVTAAIALGEAATSHPRGWTFAGAIVWRGVVYGAADGVLLSAFPILAVFAAFGPARTRRRAIGIGAVALATSMLFTAVYHVGYADFRSAKVRKPVAGDLVWSVPTLVTASAVGAPIAHVGLHVAAVVHSYDTTLFLPPHRSQRPSR